MYTARLVLILIEEITIIIIKKYPYKFTISYNINKKNSPCSIYNFSYVHFSNPKFDDFCHNKKLVDNRHTSAKLVCSNAHIYRSRMTFQNIYL